MGTLAGRGGNDTLNGNTNNDTLAGDEGNDKLTGGAGNDTLDGGDGNDIMAGGAGSDYYVISSTADKVTEAVDTSGNRDTIELHIANFTLAANFEDLILGVGAVNGTGNAVGNEIIGNDLANLLTGGAGNDELFGGNGNDTLNGGSQSDFVEGGLGADVVNLGPGGGQVIYGELQKLSDLALLGNDIITGFDSESHIALGGVLFSLGVSVTDTNQAIADGFVILDKSGPNTLLSIDADGSAGGVAPCCSRQSPTRRSMHSISPSRACMHRPGGADGVWEEYCALLELVAARGAQTTLGTTVTFDRRGALVGADLHREGRRTAGQRHHRAGPICWACHISFGTGGFRRP